MEQGILFTILGNDFAEPGVGAWKAFGRYFVNFVPGGLAIGLIFPVVDCSLRGSGVVSDARRSAIAGCLTGATVGGIYRQRVQSMALGCVTFGAAAALYDISEHFVARPSDTVEDMRLIQPSSEQLDAFGDHVRGMTPPSQNAVSHRDLGRRGARVTSSERV